MKMLVVISPAKKLNMTKNDAVEGSYPSFESETKELASYMKALSSDEISKLMGISADLADLNWNRFARFGTQETKSAVHAFAGDTYQGLDANTLLDEDLDWAQDHLRILSGLYGLLRPRDKIEPYRLEMGSRLPTNSGKNLYDFWGIKLSSELNKLALKSDTQLLLNCASKEYFSAIDIKSLKLNVVTPVFLENAARKPKIVSFYAKKARGAMARFVIQNKITKTKELMSFDTGGYAYQPDLSDEQTLYFVR